MKGTIKTCPPCGKPVVSTFEFAGAEYLCPACGWLGEIFHPRETPATEELAAAFAEAERLYDVQRAERTGRPIPATSEQRPAPTCSGCGEVAPLPFTGDKPSWWYSRTKGGVTEYACSSDCIKEGARLPW